MTKIIMGYLFIGTLIFMDMFTDHENLTIKEILFIICLWPLTLIKAILNYKGKRNDK
jgi:hypothetical protein